jgi:hypothetical protein
MPGRRCGHEETKTGGGRKPRRYPASLMTEQDRAIVALRTAGETHKAICEELGVTVGVVQTAEWRSRNDARVRKMLAERPDSIEGLSILGTLDCKAADQLRFHHCRHEGPNTGGTERSRRTRPRLCLAPSRHRAKVAGIDRSCPGAVRHCLSPIERTPQPKLPAQQQEAERQPAISDEEAWSRIVRRVGEIEQIMGTGFLRGRPAQRQH